MHRFDRGVLKRLGDLSQQAAPPILFADKTALPAPATTTEARPS
jgi:hypothetical protein